LVYNHDIYMELVPDVVEKFEYDDESIIEYFCTVGMKEKHCANKLFSPSEVRLLVPAAANECTTPSDYYWALLDHGYEDGWLLKLNKTFKPELYDVL